MESGHEGQMEPSERVAHLVKAQAGEKAPALRGSIQLISGGKIERSGGVLCTGPIVSVNRVIVYQQGIESH
jgi:hypothetical protein